MALKLASDHTATLAVALKNADEEVWKDFYNFLSRIVSFLEAPGQNYGPMSSEFLKMMKKPNAILGKSTYTGLYTVPLTISQFKELYDYQQKAVGSMTGGSVYPGAPRQANDLLAKYNAFRSSGIDVCAFFPISKARGLNFAELSTAISKIDFMKDFPFTHEADQSLMQYLLKTISSQHDKVAQLGGMFIAPTSVNLGYKSLNSNPALLQFIKGKTLISKAGIDDFYDEVVNGTTPKSKGPNAPVPQKAPSKPKEQTLEQFRGKHIVMIGKPPSGWSTEKFATELKQVGGVVDKVFNPFTTHAFYNPVQVSGDKVEKAKARKIVMVPYDTVIQYIKEA